MSSITDSIDFAWNNFIRGFPDFQNLVILVSILTVLSFICAKIPSYLKQKHEIKTGYSRKIFHFLVFTCVALINYKYGFTAVCIFGLLISGFIFLSILKKGKSFLYRALAREGDYPNQTLYIILPYFSTLFAGVYLNIFFIEFVALGYLICGIADASGEVIGTWLGKNKFKVKVFNIHKSMKSIEGTASVFLFTTLIYIVYTFVMKESIGVETLIFIILAGLGITLVEIFTPKGFDNFTIQVCAVIFYKFLIL